MNSTILIITTFILLTLISCDKTDRHDLQKQETPKALDDENSYEKISRRGYSDLVENLYSELMEKTPDLKELEIQIESLSVTRRDSSEEYDKYNEKNQSYYSSANIHVERITDSLVRNKMQDLISSSLAKYNSKILKHTELLKSIETKTLNVNDLHTVLKISRTLPLIEKYQNDNLPTTTSLENFSKKLDEVLKHADKLTKK